MEKVGAKKRKGGKGRAARPRLAQMRCALSPPLHTTRRLAHTCTHQHVKQGRFSTGATHTPGPWQVGQGARWWQGEAGIGRCNGGGWCGGGGTSAAAACAAAMCGHRREGVKGRAMDSKLQGVPTHTRGTCGVAGGGAPLFCVCYEGNARRASLRNKRARRGVCPLKKNGLSRVGPDAKSGPDVAPPSSHTNTFRGFKAR